MKRQHDGCRRTQAVSRGTRGLALAVVLGTTPGASAQVTALLSQDSVGNAGDGGSFVTSRGAVSAFGRCTAFVSNSTNLVAGDTNNCYDVFVRDRTLGTVSRVSLGTAGTQANGDSGRGYFGGLEGGAAISYDGRYVVFSSVATNLVSGKSTTWSDIFLRDRDTDADGIFDEPGFVTTTRVSTAAAGGDPDESSFSPSISAEGAYIAYASRATNLVAGDTNGLTDIFLYTVGTGTTTRVSVTYNGLEATGGHSRDPVVAGPVPWVAFTSEATNLLPPASPDTNGVADAFVRTPSSTVRVSVSSAAAHAGGPSPANWITQGGRYVVFTSAATDLLAGGADSNGAPDVFLHNRDTDADGNYDEPGQTSTVRVSLGSGPVQANGASGGGMIDYLGRFVTFASSATNLVASDSDGSNTNVFWRDLNSGQVLLVSTIPAGAQAQMGPGLNEAAMSLEGGTIAFGNYNDSPQQVYLRDLQSLDSDADGLLDSWEIAGIDSNADGTIDLTLPGANCWFKDVFVECDAMAGMLPLPATLAAIDRSFQGDDGVAVNLTLLVDETGLPVATWTGNMITWPPEFGPFKAQYFGTPAQRASPNWPNIRAAKLLAHRYCVFASANVGNTISGMAEMPGNDFFLTLGAWPAWGNAPSTQVGVFLHELGHNLGLNHGGGAGIVAPASRAINYKPNYHSVMNYTWTTPTTGYASSWVANYSTRAFNPLIELGLDESVGIGGNLGFVVPVGPLPWRLANEAGPVDFNRSGTCCEWSAQADLNYVTAWTGASLGEYLESHWDWPNLYWPLTGSANFNAGVHGQIIPGDELTFEKFMELEIALPDWTDSFETYPAQTALNIIGGWETWCEGGRDANAAAGIARSQPNAIRLSFDGSTPFGSDAVKRFVIESGKWTLSAWTYVPSGVTGSGYVVLLNQYCNPDHNWSMQIEFDADANLVRTFMGPAVPLVRDAWVELRAEIDLDADLISESYNGQPLWLNQPYSMNVSGRVGDPGIPVIAALDLFSQDIQEMYLDDLSLQRDLCPADYNRDGFVDGIDYDTFVNDFEAGNLDADFNGDGFLDGIDYDEFMNAFEGGC